MQTHNDRQREWIAKTAQHENRCNIRGFTIGFILTTILWLGVALVVRFCVK